MARFNQPEDFVMNDQSSNDSLKTMTTLVYILQAASFLVGITYLAAIVLNYIKKDETTGTLYESHFRWQMRTFWFSLLWGIIGFATALLVIGYGILFANAIWVLYRIIKGWLRLSEGREMYLYSCLQLFWLSSQCLRSSKPRGREK